MHKYEQMNRDIYVHVYVKTSLQYRTLVQGSHAETRDEDVEVCSLLGQAVVRHLEHLQLTQVLPTLAWNQVWE